MCPIMSFFNPRPSPGSADLHQLINERTEGNLGQRERAERKERGTGLDRYITGKKAERPKKKPSEVNECERPGY